MVVGTKQISVVPKHRRSACVHSLFVVSFVAVVPVLAVAVAVV